jgi:hypothetical protein
MFKDEHRVTVWNEIRQHGLRVFAKRLTLETFSEAAQIAGLNPGSGPLHLANLAWLGIASAMHQSKNFADVLGLVLKLLLDSDQFASTPLGKAKRNGQRRRGRRKQSKHDPRRRDPTEVSEEAFAKARGKMPLSYWMALLLLLGKCFQAEHGQTVRWNGFRLLAMDGTCLKLPKWKRLADYFGTASNGKGTRSPQARMVMLQFPLARIPYRYELTPTKVSEKTSAVRLAKHLAADDLVLLDRGFWSYGLFWEIQNQGAWFGIRLFKTAGLKHVRKLGWKDRLVRYAPTDRKWRKQGLPPAMLLRVIDYQIKGFRPSAVVTNITDPTVTSRQDWVRLSTQSDPGRRLDPGLYHRRWEIETTFYELKVTQGMKGGLLRSRTPESLAYEVAGHVLFYLLVRWMMVEAAIRHGEDPLRLSFTAALRELSDLYEKLLISSPQRVAQILLPRLLARIASHLVPIRSGRHYCRPHDTKVKNCGYGKRRLPSKLPANQTQKSSSKRTSKKGRPKG